MTDQVTICNLALDAVGTRSQIASLDEQSEEARKLSLHYEPALEAVLQAAHWNFARKQATLTLLKDATATPPDAVPQPWLYEYAIPADCAQVRYVMPQYSSTSGPGTAGLPLYAGPPTPFIISSDTDPNGNAVTVLLSNTPQAVLVYTYRVTNPQLFDGQFVIAFANFLGARMAISLTGDKNMAKMAFAIADSTTKEARASNGNEGLTVIDVIPDWMRVRGYASDWAYPPGSMCWMAPQNLTFVT